mmetsp:Transcript_34270/g.99544  ORF Transcript_34270/g.99544 Transcript_34270/m.99544 type:complete len:258 (+) Transcript_34270:195-968(+)
MSGLYSSGMLGCITGLFRYRSMCSSSVRQGSLQEACHTVSAGSSGPSAATASDDGASSANHAAVASLEGRLGHDGSWPDSRSSMSSEASWLSALTKAYPSPLRRVKSMGKYTKLYTPERPKRSNSASSCSRDKSNGRFRIISVVLPGASCTGGGGAAINASCKPLGHSRGGGESECWCARMLARRKAGSHDCVRRNPGGGCCDSGTSSMKEFFTTTRKPIAKAASCSSWLSCSWFAATSSGPTAPNRRRPSLEGFAG